LVSVYNKKEPFCAREKDSHKEIPGKTDILYSSKYRKGEEA
jgi:hypothetical protein